MIDWGAQRWGRAGSLRSSSLSDLREIGCKMTWPVHNSPLSSANGTTIGSKSVKFCPRPAHFSLRFLKSDRLLVWK